MKFTLLAGLVIFNCSPTSASSISPETRAIFEKAQTKLIQLSHMNTGCKIEVGALESTDHALSLKLTVNGVNYDLFNSYLEKVSEQDSDSVKQLVFSKDAHGYSGRNWDEFQLSLSLNRNDAPFDLEVSKTKNVNSPDESEQSVCTLN
jgi:hypothetical protein